MPRSGCGRAGCAGLVGRARVVERGGVDGDDRVEVRVQRLDPVEVGLDERLGGEGAAVHERLEFGIVVASRSIEPIVGGGASTAAAGTPLATTKLSRATLTSAPTR